MTAIIRSNAIGRVTSGSATIRLGDAIGVTFMAEAITIYLLFVVSVVVVTVIARLLGYEPKNGYPINSDRKKGWDPLEHHNFHTIHWHDHHDHRSHL